MTDREKAYSILSRTGTTRHLANAMTDAETKELAKIHDEATDETLKDQIADFWGRRSERLAEQKATDETQEKATDETPDDTTLDD